jgi:hypothetical protein
MGWKGLSNGALLDAAEAEGFDVMLTGDKRIQHQQNLVKRSLSLAVLDVHPRTIANLAACLPLLQEQLPLMEPGGVTVIHMPER